MIATNVQMRTKDFKFDPGDTTRGMIDRRNTLFWKESHQLMFSSFLPFFSEEY